MNKLGREIGKDNMSDNKVPKIPYKTDSFKIEVNTLSSNLDQIDDTIDDKSKSICYDIIFSIGKTGE